METEPRLDSLNEIKVGDKIITDRWGKNQLIEMEVKNITKDGEYFCEMIGKPSVNGVFKKEEIVPKEKE